MTIALIGMRGAGKSNVARRLAFIRKAPVLSTDVLVQYESGGAQIEQIVAQPDGWRRFRDIEYEVLTKACAVPGVILDCGGGIVVDLDESGREVYSDRKVDLLRSSATVVWLRGEVEALAAKVDAKTAAAADPNRPLLLGGASTVALMRARLPYYERAADHVVDIGHRSRQEIAEHLALIAA